MNGTSQQYSHFTLVHIPLQTTSHYYLFVVKNCNDDDDGCRQKVVHQEYGRHNLSRLRIRVSKIKSEGLKVDEKDQWL